MTLRFEVGTVGFYNTMPRVCVPIIDGLVDLLCERLRFLRRWGNEPFWTDR
jgi:hypothetical protein